MWASLAVSWKRGRTIITNEKSVKTFYACPVTLYVYYTSFQFLVARKVIMTIMVTVTAAMVTVTAATVIATVATVTATAGNMKRISVQKSASAAGRDSTASGTTTRRNRKLEACCLRFGSRFVPDSILYVSVVKYYAYFILL